MPPRPQTFANHAHRPTLTIVAFVCFVFAAEGLVRWTVSGGRLSLAVGVGGLLGTLFVLIWITRAYTTKLQDRIIRLEMRVRGMRVLTPEQQRLLETLSVKQVAALRFASDAELPALCERAARERLSPADIKRAIAQWVPDYDRT